MKVLFLILLCFMLSGCASLGELGGAFLSTITQPGPQVQRQATSQQPVTVITQPYVIEQPDYPAPDRYLYKK